MKTTQQKVFDVLSELPVTAPDGLNWDEFAAREVAKALEAEIVHTNAPDLLKALKRIASWSEHSPEFSIDFGSNGVRDMYRSIAKEAIAKATGQAS